MKYDLKGHSRSYKTTLMPKSLQHNRLWTDFDENLQNANIIKTQIFQKIIYDLKFHFYVMEKFCDYFTLRPSGLITTLTMDNFYPCFNTLWNKLHRNKFERLIDDCQIFEKCLENTWNIENCINQTIFLP